MRRILFYLVLLTTCSTCFAADSYCAKLDAEVRKLGYAAAAYEGRIIGKGRVFFHEAPDAKCITQDVFVIPGDYLTIYTESNGWLYVMFINKKGDDFAGWVREDRVEILGSYGRN